MMVLLAWVVGATTGPLPPLLLLLLLLLLKTCYYHYYCYCYYYYNHFLYLPHPFHHTKDAPCWEFLGLQPGLTRVYMTPELQERMQPFIELEVRHQRCHELQVMLVVRFLCFLRPVCSDLELCINIELRNLPGD